MAIHHAPIDRLESEIRRLTREGEKVVNYNIDPQRNQWVIVTDPEHEQRDYDAPQVEKRPGTADHEQAVDRLIDTQKGRPAPEAPPAGLDVES